MFMRPLLLKEAAVEGKELQYHFEQRGRQGLGL